MELSGRGDYRGVMNDKERYISEWMQIFGDVLGWSEDKTQHWIETNGYADDLETDMSILLFEPPIFWTFNEFIPVSLHTTVLEVLKIREQLWEIYMQSSASTDPEAGYAGFKQAVQALLAEYGETLPG